MNPEITIEFVQFLSKLPEDILNEIYEYNSEHRKMMKVVFTELEINEYKKEHRTIMNDVFTELEDEHTYLEGSKCTKCGYMYFGNTLFLRDIEYRHTSRRLYSAILCPIDEDREY